jgi:hypothetical protein
MEQTECSETLAYQIQTPGNYPEESIQNSEHGEILNQEYLDDLKIFHIQGKVTFMTCHNTDV